MKKIPIILIIFCFFGVFSLGAWAQTDEEATPSPDSELIQQKVEERIQKVLKTAEEKRKRALIGTLKAIADSTLTIETQLGEIETKVATDAAILNENRKKIDLEDLTVGNKLVALGYLEDSILEAKRIIQRKEFQIPETNVAFGIVTDISQEEKILTIKHPKKETVYMIDVSTTTKITKRIEGEIKTIKFSDIEENDYLVAIGKPGENAEKIITAKLIHVVSGEAEEATPSPSPAPEEE